jgi:alcohol dehydrogenase (cytochrome c)
MLVTVSYDPESNLLFWGTGNPNPNYYGADRKGDNLYTASIVAIDADTGRMRWHYQFTPHDTHDWDANQIPVLADLTIGGERRKTVMFANRNGFFYTFDRLTGALLLAKPFTGTQWAREIGKDGRPIVLNDGMVTPENPNPTCVPDLRGATNFNPPSYDPALELFFVMARESCAVYTPQNIPVQAGRLTNGGTMRTFPEPAYSAVRALDPKTGDLKWEYKLPTLNLAGVMSTASGLVFAGDAEGNFSAFDSRNGGRLWTYRMGSQIYGAAAITYMLDNRQYVLIPSGMTNCIRVSFETRLSERNVPSSSDNEEDSFQNSSSVSCVGVAARGPARIRSPLTLLARNRRMNRRKFALISFGCYHVSI